MAFQENIKKFRIRAGYKQEKEFAKVLVSKEKIEKIAEFIDEDCIDCDRCPAYNNCYNNCLKLQKIDCKDVIINYLGDDEK